MKEQFEETENMQTLQMMEIRNRIRNISLEEQDLQSKNTELLFMMQKDPLANIANRACLNQYVEQIYSQLEKNQQSLSLLIIDIDYFKQLNDTYGHQIGDQLLVKASHIVQYIIGDSFFSPLALDDFVVITDNRVSNVEVLNVADNILASTDELAMSLAHSSMIPFSILILFCSPST